MARRSGEEIRDRGWEGMGIDSVCLSWNGNGTEGGGAASGAAGGGGITYRSERCGGGN